MCPPLRTLGLALAAVLAVPALGDEPAEWKDLFARDLKGWSRSGIGKSPWHVAGDHTLTCSAGAAELLAPDREFADGTLRFEYRFVPTDKKDGYKAAVWARRTQKGTGCRVALGDDCGTLSVTVQGASDRLRSFDAKPADSPARAIGLWNQVKVQLRGKAVDVYVNGRAVASFARCDTDRGVIAFEAAGSEVEFRKVMWKDAK